MLIYICRNPTNAKCQLYNQNKKKVENADCNQKWALMGLKQAFKGPKIRKK